jgi:hypothetical protein
MPTFDFHWNLDLVARAAGAAKPLPATGYVPFPRGEEQPMTKEDLVALADALRIHNRTADGRTEFTPDHLRVVGGLLCISISQLQLGTMDRLYCRREHVVC